MAMRDITVTARDGRVSQLEQVYIRGSMVSTCLREDGDYWAGEGGGSRDAVDGMRMLATSGMRTS